MVAAAPSITHLLFADDTILFGKSQPRDVESIDVILRHLEAASGQRINRDKSNIFFGRRTPPGIINLFTSRLCIPVASVEEWRYLGFPFVSHGRQRQRLGFLYYNTLRRIRGWKEKLLSFDGRAVLIKAVVQALPIYAMSSILLPRLILKDLERVTRQY